jgi:two-component system, cell cycle sensor histidine kinase and response regulator CckA
MTTRPCPSTSEHICENREGGSWPRIVLLVEDEPFVREATRSILESAGLAVLSAADATTGLEVYKESEHAIDLLMTDMILPGRTGRQLGEDLRQRSPNLKVLVTSGYTHAEYAADEPHSNTYFLAKPYSRRGLVAKIAEIFDVQLLARTAAQAG